ncbi:Vacuolar membrane amino acid uptake transporter fnx2 [Hyphodiscus hymeniophilus]|uniref:Vacuolar membrane amino acid uptake transporter fnx2 n=1 Tax=Hyphodiscus hymeniophilus TaxID=353542 RepID=A0A9P6VCF9_9HELO|nr:Vacuolar membrane amino acid uptake transporter fnx2 [Hyphodiscus hymeniophilus]
MMLAEDHDERSANIESSSSSESSQSIDSDPERLPLINPDIDPKAQDYKSIDGRNDPETEQEESEVSEEEATPKSVLAIISLLLIDGTLVLATYGTISSEFGAFGDASWLTTSYALAMCAVQPIVGKLSDLYGRKSVLLTGYVLFASGSVLTGMGQAMWQVIAGRIVSGIGAAGMTVIVSILITDLVPLIQVAAWRSYVNVVATLGRSIGGPLGGLLADTMGWRWSFVGQGPIILIAIFLVALKLPSTSSPPLTKGEPSKLRRIDFIGAFMLATTIVSLLGALSLGGQNLPWSHPIVTGLALGSLLLGASFAAYEVRYALEPIFPPTLVIQRDVATPYGIYALQTAAQLGMMYTVPLYFRSTQGSSNTTAGSHLFPAVLGNAVGGLLSGFLIQRTGRYKSLTILSSVSACLSYGLLILRWHGHTSWLESLEIVPGGFGTGMAGSATFIALTVSVDKSEIAVATGGMYLMSAVGMVVGVAASSAMQLSTLKNALAGSLHGPDAAEVIREVVSDVGKVAGLDEKIRAVVIQCYAKSLEYSHMFSLGCSLVAFLIAFTVRERSLR